jgi:leader peptidase (prepilin peptidase)/N-methyltransferase
VLTLVELPHWLLAGLAVVLGLLFGSFLNVVIYRVPRDESIVRPGSHCPACGAPIRAWQNVPVLSWLLLGGKARCCGTPIPARYPLVELLGGLLGWAVLQTIVLQLPPGTAWWRALLSFAVHLALGLGLIAAAFIDLEHMLLPDEITIGGALLGVASVPLRPGIGWSESLIGAAIGFVIVWLPFDLLYSKLRGHPGMGLGDAKLTMLAGAWFGWPGAVFALLAGAVQGTLITLVVFLVQGRIEEPEAVRREREELLAEIEAAEGEEKKRLEEELDRDPIGREAEEGIGKARLAFGPFLVLATLEFMLFGKVLVHEYLAWLWTV